MKRKAMIAIVGTLFLVCGAALTGLCDETETVNPSSIYGAFVDNYIQKCETKADLLESGSPNIRRDAVQATVKGVFLQSNRTAMVEYLMDKNVPLNAHRIEYHLNMKYYESALSQQVYALLLKEEVNR